MLYALGNSGDAGVAPVAEGLLADPSPLVRGAAVWALSRLLSGEAFAGLRATQTETDPDVLAEWTA